MTAIGYPDQSASSPNGKYTLEARSPHNGTINHGDGRPPSEDEFEFKYRQHQDEFRYRLIDHTCIPLLSRLFRKGGGSVVWERWQAAQEDSPHELVVSDNGWSILRTHGFRPEVIVVAPDGKDTLRVRIADFGVEQYPRLDGVPIRSWTPEHLVDSTAGLYWTEHSWRFFFPHRGHDYFVWRTSWGQRLLVDLRNAALLPEPDASDPLAVAMIESEKRGVCALLSSFANEMNEVRKCFKRSDDDQRRHEDMCLRIGSLTSAVHLAGVHRLAAMIPRLRDWEPLDCPGLSMGSIAMVDWWLEVQQFRPILHHTLRLLGEEPLGFAAYHFRNHSRGRFPLPERVPDRDRWAGQVGQGWSAERVLERLGSPDFVKRRSRKEGSLYHWFEDWEYDFRHGGQWTTFRLTWEDRRDQGELVRIQALPAYWLSTKDREANILWLN